MNHSTHTEAAAYLQQPIEHLDITSLDVRALVDQMDRMAFSARDLSRAAQILDRMVADESCMVILCLAGSLVSAGLKDVFVEMIRTVVRRGVESGDFQVAVDPVQLYISIAALSFFYLSNSATLSVIFGRDLLDKKAKDERLAHMSGLVLAALTGQSADLLEIVKAPKPRAAVAQTA